MIYKNRKFVVGNPKVGGSPFVFRIGYKRNIDELVLTRGLFGLQYFSIEELKQMLEYLEKVNEEYKEETKNLKTLK